MASRIRNVRLSPVMVAVVAAMAAPCGFAQTSESKPEQEVVVSGSRIKRDNYSTSAPVQIIRNDDSVQAGFTSTAEVLQGTAVTGGQGQVSNQYAGYIGDGGPGANTLGLRGLQPTRSLILLNGRRMSPSGTRGAVGAADLNTLPTAIVDRVEVLKDGSSSIYGSDAVAGVVNIITKKNLTGVTTSLNQTATAEGGGETTNFSLVGGFVGDKARFSGSYQYNERKAVTWADREFTRCPIEYKRSAPDQPWGSGDYIDPATGKPKCFSALSGFSISNNAIFTSGLTGVGAVGADPARANGLGYTAWRPNPNVTTGRIGYEGVAGGTTPTNIRDTTSPDYLKRDLFSPTKNHNAFVQGSVDLEGGAEVYYEAMFNRRDSSQNGIRQIPLFYTKGSPLIPSFFADSTYQNTPSEMNPAGSRVGVLALYITPYLSAQTVDFSRVVAGVRGAIGKTGWDYDVVASRSDSKGTYSVETYLTDRLKKSMDVVASGSGYACRDSSGGCVAAPSITPDLLKNRAPTDWLNYVLVPTVGVTKFKEDVVTATTTGTLFNMPAGKAKAAFGAEIRSNSINDQPSPESVAGNLFYFSSSRPTTGSDKAKDIFGEVELPILKNLNGIQELTINASTRFADYRSYGSASTGKVGAFLAVDKSLSFRATTGTSYRAPALYEMFQGASTGFLSASTDPCDTSLNPVTDPVRAANCLSEGLSSTFRQPSSVTQLSTGGYESGLKAETSKNISYGFIFQPELPQGMGDLSIAVDRFDIKVANGVSRVSTGFILGKCYDAPLFRAAGGYCNLVTRKADTTLSVVNGFVNLAEDQVRGFDITTRYSTNVSDGKLRVNTNLTRYTGQSNRLYTTDPFFNGNGTIGSPKWSGNLDVNYSSKDWSYFYGVNWVGKTSDYGYYNGVFPGLYGNADTSLYQWRTPNYFSHTVSVRYRNPVQKWDVVMGVRNLTDKQPPSISALRQTRLGNAPFYSGYDLMGRTMYLNVNKSF